MKGRICFGLMAGICLSLSVPNPLCGQGGAYYSTLVGTVHDSSGAVIPSAEVMATNVSTNVQTPGRTNSTGDYRLDNLLPGVYTLRASAEGFKVKVLTDIRLVTALTTRVDVGLDVGSVNQSVQVSGQAPVMQTESGETGGLMGAREVESLPILNRDFQNIALLFSGVVTNSAVAAQPGLFSVNGLPSQGVGWQVDGGSLVNRNIGAPVEKIPIDSIQEIKIETANYSAEYGQHAGGFVNVATKHGTNRVHGTLFEYNRNDHLAAANFFATGLPKAPVHYNQFGGTVGGPIKKDKLFFFASYEGVRNLSPVTKKAQVPTQAERQGNFQFGTGLVNANIYNPFNIDPNTGLRIQYPNNQLDPTQFNAVSKQYLAKNLWSLPNTTGVPNLVFNGSSVNNFDRGSGRIDYNLSAKDIVFGRYGHQTNPIVTPGAQPAPGNFTVGNNRDGTDMVAGWTHLVSPQSFNEFRFSFANGYSVVQQGGFATGSNTAADLGFSYASQLTGAAVGCPYVGFSINGGSEVAACGMNGVQNFPSRTYYFTDDYSFIRGSHNLKAGVLYSNDRDNSQYARPGGGNYSFSGVYTAQLNDTSGKTGQAFADFLIGGLGGVTWQTQYFNEHIRVNSYGAYLQDDWKVRPKLSVQLGIRYEIRRPPYDTTGANGGNVIGLQSRTGQYLLFPANSKPFINANIPDGNIGLPYQFADNNGLYYAHWRDVGPRAGFAYRLGSGNRTVIRGGFGMYYEVQQYNQFQAISQPWVGVSTTAPRTVAFEPPPYALGTSPGGNPSYVFPAGSLIPSNAYVDPNGWVPGRAFEWNLMLQRGFAKDWSIEGGYVGNKGDHLLNAYRSNRTYMPGYTFNYPDGTSFTITDSTPLLQRKPWPTVGTSYIGMAPGLGHGFYDAAQITLIRQFSHGFEMRAGYTRSVSKGNEGQVGGQSSVVQDEFHQNTLNFYRKTDVPNNTFITYVWNLPGYEMKGFKGAFLGGWQHSAVIRFQSGERVDAREEYPQWPGAVGVFVKPVMSCDPNANAPHTIQQWFNTGCFSQPGVNQFGSDSATNAVRGAPLRNIDMAFSKFFNLHVEQAKLQFRAELFNAFNHPQFQDPDALRGDPGFGKVTAAFDPRVIQLGLNLEF